MAGVYTVSTMAEVSGASAHRVLVTVVQPERTAARGGIIVLHENRRITPGLLDLLRALSAEGWTAVVPHLFHGKAVAAAVFGPHLHADVDAAHAWLVRSGVDPDRIGVLGFDQAGAAAFLVATRQPFGAAVSIAPRGLVAPADPDAPALVDAAADLQAPWLGLFGEDDAATPQADIDALAESCIAARVATNVVRIPGLTHRPDAPDTVALPDDPDALATLRARLFDWYDTFLR
jgi:carboxymethylenebutenolidase